MLNPYSYSSPDDGVSFHFTTKSSITYSLALGDYSDVFGVPENCKCRLIFFVLTPINPPNIIPFDYRVKDTVVSFLIEYLSKNPDVIFYVCSEKDDQEIIRQQVFNRWFEKHKPDHISREMRVIDDSNTYFLFHAENPLVSSVLQIINNYIQNSQE